MRHHVALLDSDWNGDSYTRGEIVVARPGTGPPGISWATFEPPAGLDGTPELQNVVDNGTGNLTFRYRLAESESQFVLRARLGIPVARFVEVDADVPVRQESGAEPPLEFGADPTASFEGCGGGVRWNPRGCTPEPQPEAVWDPLRWEG